MNVYIPGTGFATQGPCADGFHVPLKSEIQGLITIMNGLNITTMDGWKTNLHLPLAGKRNCSNSDIESHDIAGFYWSSSPYGDSYPNHSTYLNFNSVGVYYNLTYRADSLPIRGFKDSFVVPTSGWTVIQGTIGSAGIFWNQTDGIISITSDGTTGYTIQDKNIGATTVYSNGDTLSAANMGYMYQWGNNYGFPSTGTISKTSSTQVNASTYGPGNYYISDTFIKGTDWSSVHNDNLRGGVDGNVQVVNELKNAYIGEVIECDFTQSDCGFTFFEKSGGTNVTSYGRNSNGFYVLPASGYYQQYASWKIPNNIYSKGTIKKAVFTINGQSTRNGCGFNTAGDAKRMRHYTAFRVIWGTQNSTGTSENSPANTDWTFTVDLENKLLSTSWSNITLSLTDNAISAFNTDWSAGNIAVQLLSYTDNTYSYLKNITFYF